MYKFDNISDDDIMNQYIKRIAPVSMNRYTQIAYYEHEVFRDLYINTNYMISNFGRIYSKSTNMIINQHIDRDGFFRTEIIDYNNTRRSYHIHDLVMQTFAYRQDYVPNCNFLIKHVNGNKLQNVYCPGHPLHNLEWSDSPQYLQYIINMLPKDINEEFRPFPLDPKYLISNKGKVFSLVHNIFLMQKQDNGYHRVSLSNKKMYTVHRLVMITFAYRPDYASLEVNHIDGDKSNNVYYGPNHPETNLEWCTSQENRRHAVEHDLVAHGENHTISIFNDSFIEMVCAAINENPYATSNEIAAKLNIEQSSQFASLVSQLRCGVRWRRIVEKYPNICKVENASKFTEPVVREICQVINENPRMPAPKIAEVLNMEPTESFIRLVHKLRNGETWLRITKDYPNVVRYVARNRNKQMK